MAMMCGVFFVPVWECTCALCTGQWSVSEQLCIKGFHGDVLPKLQAGGGLQLQNEVKHHLLAEDLRTGTFQVSGTKKALMEGKVKSFGSSTLRWEYLGAFSGFESPGLLSVLYTDGAGLLCTDYSWIVVKHVRLFNIKRKVCCVCLLRRSVV